MIHQIAPYDVPRFEADDGGFELWVAGDRQEGSPGYIAEAWQEFKRQFTTSKRKKAFLGLGDYGDWLRPSLRPSLKNATSKDNSARRMLDKSILLQHDPIIDAMDFLKGHCLGLHEGHHNWTTLDGINLDQRLSSALEAPFLGFAATTRLVLGPRYKNSPEEKTVGDGRRTYVQTIFSTHGNANGRKVAGALSWAENNLANAYGADFYIIGHGCKNANSIPFERDDIRRNGPPGLMRKTPRILAVGGFCRGWTDGWESDYVEQAGMSPQALGWAVIRFKLVVRANASLANGLRGAAAKTLDIEVSNKTFTELGAQEDEA